jgi:hypothetical protein
MSAFSKKQTFRSRRDCSGHLRHRALHVELRPRLRFVTRPSRDINLRSPAVLCSVSGLQDDLTPHPSLLQAFVCLGNLCEG